MLKLATRPANITSILASAYYNLSTRPAVFFVNGEEQVHQLQKQILASNDGKALRLVMGANMGDEFEDACFKPAYYWSTQNFLRNDGEFASIDQLEGYKNVIIINPEKVSMEIFDNTLAEGLDIESGKHEHYRIAIIVNLEEVLAENYDGEDCFYYSPVFNSMDAVEFLVTMEPEPKYNGWEFATKLFKQTDFDVAYELEKMLRL
jgi:hypothetical protein